MTPTETPGAFRASIDVVVHPKSDKDSTWWEVVYPTGAAVDMTTRGLHSLGITPPPDVKGEAPEEVTE